MHREQTVALGVCAIAVGLILAGVVNVDVTPHAAAQVIATPALFVPRVTPVSIMVFQTVVVTATPLPQPTAEPPTPEPPTTEPPTPEPIVVVQQAPPQVVYVQVPAPPVEAAPAPVEEPAPEPTLSASRKNEGETEAKHRYWPPPLKHDPQPNPPHN